MPGSIGLRQYKIFVTERGRHDFVDTRSATLLPNLERHIDTFFSTHSSNVNERGLERSWRIEEIEKDAAGCSRGIIYYGTYGFESDLQDQDTGETNYTRKPTDIEIIPLFYEILLPEGEDFALASFQSFMGRSCIAALLSRFKSEFEATNDGRLLKALKIMPNDSEGSALSMRSVKGLTLISRHTTSDITDRLFSGDDADHVRVSLNISAGRKKRLGTLGDLLQSVPPSGVIAYAGFEFDDAVAHVRVGNRTRPVGVFGANRDVGVVDITEDVTFSMNGHPTFESVKIQADQILSDLYEPLAGTRR